jgi:hypothetical protein
VIGWARRIWDGAFDASKTPVVAYFVGRGITIAPPPTLRWSPSLRRPDKTYVHYRSRIYAIYIVILKTDQVGRRVSCMQYSKKIECGRWNIIDARTVQDDEGFVRW